MPFDIETLTEIHTALSFIALFTGIMAVRNFFTPVARFWTTLFLVSAVACSVTGFLFPFGGFTPAIGVGVMAMGIFAAMAAAHYGFHRAGFWQVLYTAGMVVSLYFLVFVAIAQAFGKVAFLHDLAPTLSEPPFAVAQGIALAGFVWLGVKAVKKMRGPRGDAILAA